MEIHFTDSRQVSQASELLHDNISVTVALSDPSGHVSVLKSPPTLFMYGHSIAVSVLI